MTTEIKKEQEQPTMEMDIEKEAINLVKSEKELWSDSWVFVTDKVQFNVRNLIRQLRKNYWGIFDDDKDPISGKKMTWVPLTEWVCDQHVAKADVNTEHFKWKATKSGAIGFVSLVRHLVTAWMNKEVFGEALDTTERQLAINGSHVWKTFEGRDEHGKPMVIRRDVDILNLYFDWSADSIQSVYRFTERALLFTSDVMSMKGWMNRERAVGTEGLHNTDADLSKNTGRTTTKMVDVYELWGKIPKYFITGKKEDTEEIDGHIVVSGLQEPGREVLHLIETNKGGKKPYEEVHTKKIAGRWLGRGPAESVMMLQSWLNMIVNIRKLRQQITQLGIFKVKKGTGTSPQQLARLAVNGVLPVNDMRDIEQLVVQDIPLSSYKEEQNVTDWAKKLTSAYEGLTGEPLPSSTPATNAVIQKQAGESSFAMFSNAIGFFIQRWVKRHALPILLKATSKGDILAITGETDELDVIDERLVMYYAYQQIDKMDKDGKFVDAAQVDKEISKARRKLKAYGQERFVKMINDIDCIDYDLTFYVNKENLDVQEMANNLATSLKIAPEYRDIVLPYLFDLMGLPSYKIEQKKIATQQTGQMTPEQMAMAQQGQGQPTPQGAVV
ncbi:MAG: portal protein [Siphoviridae sp. cttb18]|nr:MAG: portal protein [Siphoviridae sp. cttb18]